jgi:hypothetical protein
MIDIDAEITAELERMVPVAAEPDWDAVTRAAGLGRRRPGFRTRRQLGLVALAALVIAGAAVAAAKEIPWWQSGRPPIDPQAVASVARDNMPADVDTARARTVVEDGNAALVAVPLDASGYCLIPAIDGHGSLGSQCDYQVVQPEQGIDDRTVSLARPATAGASAEWLVYGRITDPRATKLELGPLTIELSKGGFFLKQVPERKWATLDGTANSGRVVDGSGRTLRSGCVNWGLSPLSVDARSLPVTLFGEAADGCKPQPIPSVPTLDLAQAEKLVQFTLVHDFSIWKAGTPVAMWSAPAQGGSICEWVGAESPAPTGTSHGVPSGPGECGDPSVRPSDVRQRPFVSLNVSVGGGGLITGEVGTDSGVAKVALETGSGSTVLPLEHGWFIGQLPEGSRVGKLPPGGPFVVIVYGADGSVVARRSIEDLVRESTPH